MNIPSDLYYTKDHEWAKVEGNVAVIGITEYAQEALGEIVYLEIPKSGTPVKAGGTFGVVESVKAVSDLYSPATGKVIEGHTALADSPAKINEDPYGEGWLIKIDLSDPSELSALMKSAEYEKYLAEESK